MSYTLNIHCIWALSVRSFVSLSVRHSVGPSIGPFIDSSAGWMHCCLPVRRVFASLGQKEALIMGTSVFFDAPLGRDQLIP